MEEKRKPQRRGGLNPSREDLQWLRLLDMGSKDGVPTFELSRLIALGYVDMQAGAPAITAKGRDALSRSG